ncbi:uncharacterized protein [Euwallacea similis]|uniref:uncharacterized protein isoform X2 n=1 Tax=Euwallacea similis TaxID=1736056 RepID=UPI00344ED096
MKTKFIILCGLLALASICSARPAETEYEYEDEPAPPPKKAPARPLVGRRNPLAPQNKKAASTTTTTTEAAAEVEVEEGAEGDYVEEQQQETSSTTETPKKFLKGGIVRPFRSNDDLLASLKRRREQVVSNKQIKPAPVSEPKEEVAEPVQKESKPAAASGRRNRFSKPGKSAKSEEIPEESASTTTPARTGRGRFSARS